MKTKLSGNSGSTLSFADVGKSCPSRKFLTWSICILKLFYENIIFVEFRNFQFPSTLYPTNGGLGCCQLQNDYSAFVIYFRNLMASVCDIVLCVVYSIAIIPVAEKAGCFTLIANLYLPFVYLCSGFLF